MYKVNKEQDNVLSSLGSFDTLDEAIKCAFPNKGYVCLYIDGNEDFEHVLFDFRDPK